MNVVKCPSCSANMPVLENGSRLSAACGDCFIEMNDAEVRLTMERPICRMDVLYGLVIERFLADPKKARAEEIERIMAKR